MTSLRQLFIVASLSSVLKLLLIPSYKSSDFDVHRNWLAITHKLSYKRWYFENTSEWTLDYPPFFAWFECGMAQVGQYFEDGSGMLDITSGSNNSTVALNFQRLSVIVADFVLYYSSYRCCFSLATSHSPAKTTSVYQEKSESLIFLILVIFNAGLFMVDHIHFQYNGFLFGILFLSIYNILQENIIWGSFWFATLLNFKHIFLYMAPAYGIFLLRTYCMNAKQRGLGSFSIIRLVKLATVVIGVFVVSFGPFMDHIDQVLSRLFPFKRGLTHAYWAPNFWALYNVADKIASIAGRRLNMLSPDQIAGGTFSKGLVEEVEHVVLPSISPLVTVILVLISILPCLIDMWFWPRSLSYKHLSNQFLRGLILVALSAFMFGWHVHEKAILMALLPFTLLALRGTRKDAEIFVFLQVVAHYSLFPLLFQPYETIIKITLTVLYAIFSFSSFDKLYKSSVRKRNSRLRLPMLNIAETVYVLGFVFIELYTDIIHRFLPFSTSLPFLPLMLTSTYCAFGILWCWLKLYYAMLTDRSGYPIEWTKNRQKDGATVNIKKSYIRSHKTSLKTD